MGAVSDWVNMGDLARMRMWLLAIAVAVLGASALQLAGVVDLSKSIYPGPSFPWLSSIVGGFLFGVGMTLGSGCGSKTLIRVGAGNLKSLIVYVFLGIAAYMTLRGVLGAFRVGVLEKAVITLPAGQDLPSLLGVHRAILAALVAGAILAFVYSSKHFRSNFDYTLGGVVTGLVVVGGWFVSGYIGHVAEDPQTLQEAFVATNSGRMESFSFVSPMAYTLDYLMLWTDKSKIITYGIASGAGVIAGSAAYYQITQRFSEAPGLCVCNCRDEIVTEKSVGRGLYGMTGQWVNCTVDVKRDCARSVTQQSVGWSAWRFRGRAVGSRRLKAQTRHG